MICEGSYFNGIGEGELSGMWMADTVAFAGAA